MHRILLLPLLLSTLAITAAPSLESPHNLSAKPLVVHGADEAQVALISAAADRFAEVGLDLPPVEVVVHNRGDACRGHNGYWTPGEHRDRIDLCLVEEFLVLHEFAHAWDRHAATDGSRLAFMAEHPQVEWRQEGHHHHQGVERFADAIAWGLLHTPIGELDNPIRREAIERRAHVFELATGLVTPRLHASE